MAALADPDLQNTNAVFILLVLNLFPADTLTSKACLLIPEVVEGPYYIQGEQHLQYFTEMEEDLLPFPRHRPDRHQYVPTILLLRRLRQYVTSVANIGVLGLWNSSFSIDEVLNGVGGRPSSDAIALTNGPQHCSDFARILPREATTLLPELISAL